MQLKLQSKYQHAGNDKINLIFDTNIDAAISVPPSPGIYGGGSTVSLFLSEAESNTYIVGQVYDLALTAVS